MFMKKFVLASLFAASATAFAQFAPPAASPRQRVEQQFSIAKVTVDYGRPAVKGRKVFGELVPFGQVWRAGANSSTKITFDLPMVFGNTTVPAGTYGLFINPTATDWEIILNKDAQQWGAFTYDPTLDVAKTRVPVTRATDFQEYFEVDLEPQDDDTLNLVFRWENARVTLPVHLANPDKIKRITQKLTEIRSIQQEK